jgi:copper chaperone NosL
MKVATVLLTMVLAGACAGRAFTPPAIVVDRSACSKCGMLVSELAYAAAIRWADGHDEIFDDIGCLVAKAQQTPDGDRQYWFHDAAHGGWITDARPVWVTSPELKTPMGGGIAAYRDRATAEQAAARLRGRLVLDISELMTPERNAR